MCIKGRADRNKKLDRNQNNKNYHKIRIDVLRGEVEPIRDEILYDIANLEGMNLTINVPNTWPNGTLEVKC